MLVSKYVQLEFVSPKIQAVDAIYDLRKAAESAGLNLYSRFNVQLQMPKVVDTKVIVEILVPENLVDFFSVGNRLRGISAYLLKYCNGRYEQYLVGQRLLTYTEVTEQAMKPKSLSTTNLLDAITDFIALMLRTDDEARSQVARIMAILSEGSD